jgi:flagellar protein FlbB
MAFLRSVGRTVMLLLLILILVCGGLLWFDYLGVIQAKRAFAPLYRLLGLEVQTSVSATAGSSTFADLDEDRLKKRLEALEVRTEELNKRESDVATLEVANAQIAEELAARVDAQNIREETFNNSTKKYDDVRVTIDKNVRYLNSMTPQGAVNILLASDDQSVIDILRRADEIAAEEGGSSMASTWLMTMPAERSAQILRKMQSKPVAPLE